MQNEKLAIIGLVVIVVGAFSIYLGVMYGEDILANLSGEGETIALGDCADVHYVGTYASNGTVFDFSYDDAEAKTGGMPLNVFVSLNSSASPPEGYEDYVTGIEGFIEGLVGLKKGETATIGPIPPEKAYGLYPEVGDTLYVTDPSTGAVLLNIEFVAIEENVSIPEEYVEMLGNGTTTLFTIKDLSSVVGDYYNIYPSWINATIITKTNETKMWIYTTPSQDKQTNFTWIDPIMGIEYWENASSITGMNNSTIVVTHTPAINDTFVIQDWSDMVTYTVVSMNDTAINVSYDDGAGNITYDVIDRIVTIERNESFDIAYEFPQDLMEYLIYQAQQYNPDITMSVHPLAGKSLTFEVKIVDVYKAS
ncbi:MAG: FKBP-type peptidyl-prolyl cis-trans isomerase [Candidatus Thermoplasmatota archaeon]|nr:FKBP-type peptidyl-prolyl cis-trans isomerase [Candidatus Thermoplasmatota archaeon]